MVTMFASRTLSISIGRKPSQVYEFVSNPENLHKWAKGLGKSIKKQGADWTIDTPQGQMKFRFAEKNDFGVLDHYVTTAPGVEIYVPMRVLSNGNGSEIIFTLYRSPDMSDEMFAKDLKLVGEDLRTLKELLEK
jgi:Polyketide cyclase / dehydrase and lipid transport.